MELSTEGELQSFVLDVTLLKKSALILRAINHKLRQQLLKHINDRGEITVSELYKKFRVEQSVVSQQLGVLRNAGFVNTRRDGKYIYYSVNHQRLKVVHDIAGRLLSK